MQLLSCILLASHPPRFLSCYNIFESLTLQIRKLCYVQIVTVSVYGVWLFFSSIELCSHSTQLGQDSTGKVSSNYAAMANQRRAQYCDRHDYFAARNTLVEAAIKAKTLACNSLCIWLTVWHSPYELC